MLSHTSCSSSHTQSSRLLTSPTSIDLHGHLYHPQLAVSIRVHSCCYMFCEFGQMYNDVLGPSQYHTEYFNCPKNPLCSTRISPPPATTDLFPVSIVLPFPEYHSWNHIVCCLFILASFAQLYAFLRSLYVFSWVDSSFLFQLSSVAQSCPTLCDPISFQCWVIFFCLDVPLFIHSPTKGRIGCFQVLAIMSKDTINVFVKGFLWA